MTAPVHDSIALAKLMRKLFPSESVTTVWEIGSRDGQDGLHLASAFPQASVYAFEPNPETFPAVESAALGSSGRMRAVNVALTSSDGPVEFMQIDTVNTQSVWSDGNPGASSLFSASGAYDHIERYVQRPVSVESARADSVIERGIAPAPQVVWMDMQGAEALVLEGFGVLLAEVSLIYVELSLHAIYAGQALAPEIVEMLSTHFRWYSVPRPGPWQFDAVFVSRRARSRVAWARDRVLKTAMTAPYRPGIEYPVTFENFRKFVTRASTRTATEIVRRSPKRPSASSVVRALSTPLLGSRPLPLPIRVALDEALPADPLGTSSRLQPIEIVIPCAEKDVDMLVPVVVASVANCRNPVSCVTVIIPDGSPEPVFNEQVCNVPVQIRQDSKVLSGIDVAAAISAVPQHRRGWILQQLVKLAAVGQSESRGVLVVDADTLLLRPRTWLAPNGRQILCLSQELHQPYRDHFAAVWGSAHAQRASFVTHHQLMQPAIIREMFEDDLSGLVTWVEALDHREPSNASEYHSYGTYLINRHPDRVALARWGNVGAHRPRQDESDEMRTAHLREKYPQALSVSMHSYM